MDGENHGKPYCLRDDLGGKPTIFGKIHIKMFFFGTPKDYVELGECLCIHCIIYDHITSRTRTNQGGSFRVF